MHDADPEGPRELESVLVGILDRAGIVAFAFSGGLGLPDRDYYFRDDARTRQHREAYLEAREAFEALRGNSREPPSSSR